MGGQSENPSEIETPAMHQKCVPGGRGSEGARGQGGERGGKGGRETRGDTSPIPFAPSPNDLHPILILATSIGNYTFTTESVSPPNLLFRVRRDSRRLAKTREDSLRLSARRRTGLASRGEAEDSLRRESQIPFPGIPSIADLNRFQ